MFVNEEDLSNPIGKDIHHVETMSEGQNMEPHVESYIDQHVEPNVGASDLTSDKPQAEPPYVPIGDQLVVAGGHLVNTPIIDKVLDDIINDTYVSYKDSSDNDFNKNPQNGEAEVQRKKTNKPLTLQLLTKI